MPVPFLNNRRQARRFALRLPVRYAVVADDQARAGIIPFPMPGCPAVPRPGGDAGSGELLDISSRGALFTTSARLSPGQRVELQVRWPVMLDGEVPLNLVVLGRIVRAEQGRAAIRIRCHEFRTARARAAMAGAQLVQAAPRMAPPA